MKNWLFPLSEKSSEIFTGDMGWNNFLEVQNHGITELAEVIPFDDAELDNDIRERLQKPLVKLQDYGYGAEREEEYFTMLNEISDYLTER